VPDNTYLQRHVGSAIAWNVWQYFQVTYDIEFLQFYGAELILDIARFWSSLAMFNGERGRYEIHGVMGPDEFHEGYPGSPTPGLNNNAYTNIMAVWVLRRALDVLDLLPDMRLRYRGHSLDLRLTSDTLTVRGREPGAAPIKLSIKDEVYEFTGGSTRVFTLGRAGT
jgi:trehalose/maltose hydrolase-like predicted phosphorylase